MTIKVIAHFPRVKRVPIEMSRSQAHKLLDGRARGRYVSRRLVDAALRATGDLPPEVSLAYSPANSRRPQFGRTV